MPRDPIPTPRDDAPPWDWRAILAGWVIMLFVAVVFGGVIYRGALDAWHALAGSGP